MPACTMMALFALVYTGCANVQLKRSAIAQASTITKLQYQQVLNNLAMFASEPWSVPWHVNLRDGSAQVTDSGTGSILLDLVPHSFTGTHPSLSASRTVVEQWGMHPVTDDLELRLLRVAYQRALGLDQAVDEDLIKDLSNQLKQQISINEDVRIGTQAFYETHLFESLNEPNREPLRDRGSLYSRFDEVTLTSYDPCFTCDPTREHCTKIKITRNGFDPSTAEVDVGDAVIWVNDDNQSHFVEIPGASRRTGPIPPHRESVPITIPNVVGLAELIFRDSSGITGRLILNHRQPRSPLVQEVCRQVKDVYDEIAAVPSGWFMVGRKKDVPKDACYVGHYKGCNGDCYAWVCPEGLPALADFTIKILSLSGVVQERQIISVPGGPRYSPGYSTGATGSPAFRIR